MKRVRAALFALIALVALAGGAISGYPWPK
jgi:hypothetical protein